MSTVSCKASSWKITLCWKCNELKNWLQLYGRAKLQFDTNYQSLVDQDKDKEEQYEWRKKQLTGQGPHYGQTMLFHQWKKVCQKMKAMKVTLFRTDIYLHNSIKVSFRKFHFHFYLLKFFSTPVYPLPPFVCFPSYVPHFLPLLVK